MKKLLLATLIAISANAGQSINQSLYGDRYAPKEIRTIYIKDDGYRSTDV